MDIWDALESGVGGIANSALRHQMKHSPKMRADARARARKLEGCTPCAAGAYVQQLRDTFAAPKKGRKKK